MYVDNGRDCTTLDHVPDDPRQFYGRAYKYDVIQSLVISILVFILLFIRVLVSMSDVRSSSVNCSTVGK